MSGVHTRHTAIISDLHLCEAEPVNPKYPLWKKFKTKEFFYDETFAKFLYYIESKAKGEPVELILNGDIFDFDSVTSYPEEEMFRVHWLEKKRGLFPRPERALYKFKRIVADHPIFFAELGKFIERGNQAIFIIGNHDVELHFQDVKNELIKALALSSNNLDRVQICEWFYISHGDTLIEHGNQYDPYCVCEDPVNPFVIAYNHISMKLPFGNLACRYIMNGMGFFNPHVDSNYIMSLKDYILIFFRYMVKAQPFLVLTWFFGAVMTLLHSFIDRLRSPLRNPLQIEKRIEDIAKKSQATPQMVRELRELFVAPASSKPFLLLRELWLDRALILFVMAFLLYQIFSFIRSVYHVSFFWMFIPFFLFLPFFLFYSRSITSLVSGYKEPNERILSMVSAITGVRRIIYGHTHMARHEMRGIIEHLNSGCWSPAFLDIECTQSIDLKTFVWISPSNASQTRQARLLQFVGDGAIEPKLRSKKRNATKSR